MTRPSEALARAMLATKPAPGTTRLIYGVATDVNTVTIEGSATAVELPAIQSVVAGDYVAILEAGADRVIVGPVESPEWVDVTFSGSWYNYGSGFQTVQYRKRGDVVTVRGLARNNSNTSAGDVIFPLPAGLRPAATELKSCTDAKGGTVGHGVAGVYANGNVTRYQAATATNWIDLSFEFTVA